ncbi:MAG TPA: hypothetical protein VF771_00500, partial [Longimicrobiaceae bacterium]
AATLAALSITDELFRAREEIRRLREEADRRTGEIAEILEAAEAAGAERRPVRRPSASSPAWTTEAGDASPTGTPAPSSEATPAWSESPNPPVEDDAPRPDLAGGEPELMLPPPE